MKRKLTALLMLPCAIISAQVGIGTQTLANSEALSIASPNKGVLLPNVNIPDLNAASPVVNPANSLLVYNTNTTSGKGFYIWKNSKWNVLLNSSNIYKFLGIVRSETVTSSGGISDNTENGAVSYTLGEIPSAHDWKLIPGLTKNISIFSPVNNVSVASNGVVQINSTASQNTVMTYAVGLFIDDKLIGVRNFIINGNENCLYNDYNIFFNSSNLAVGSRKIEIYQTLRTRNLSTQTINFGGKVSTCNNLNSSMDRSLMNIQISEQ